MPTQKSAPFLPARGNYRELLFYKKAEVLYDITFRFCQRLLQKSDRTFDQMLQADCETVSWGLI